MKKKLLVIGGVAAGASAAAKARRTDSEMEIKIVADGEYVSYGSCGLPYFIGGVIAEKQQLLVRSAESFTRQGIEVKTVTRAVEIIPGDKKVVCIDLAENRKYEEFYDKLVIATGARPAVYDWPGRNMGGIFSLRTIHDGVAIREYLQEEKPKRALIIGAGYIGLEMIENILPYGCQVTLVERGPQVVPNMDPDMAAIIQKHLEQHGVEVLLNQAINGFTGQEAVAGAYTGSGHLPADFVLLSMGVQPNSELAAAAGIELGAGNAIQVNRGMETNIADIYAAGDCATTYHLVSGSDMYIPMGTTANKQGRVAGENAAGGTALFRGVLGTGIARVLGLEISRTGYSEKDCLGKGIHYASHTIKAKTAALHGGDMWVKIIIDKTSERLLGAQIVGDSGAAKRIDTLAAAITMGAAIDNLVDMDLAYAPFFSPVWDPLLVALNQFR